MSAGYDLEAGSRDWGDEYLIEGISVKPFACCRSMHPAINAVLELRAENDLEVNQNKFGLLESDYISIHVPLSDKAHGMIGARALQWMKSAACA